MRWSRDRIRTLLGVRWMYFVGAWICTFKVMRRSRVRIRTLLSIHWMYFVGTWICTFEAMRQSRDRIRTLCIMRCSRDDVDESILTDVGEGTLLDSSIITGVGEGSPFHLAGYVCSVTNLCS